MTTTPPATIEDLRRYQRHLVDQGISAISLNAAIIGLKFFFDVTLDHLQLMSKMQSVRTPRTLPVYIVMYIGFQSLLVYVTFPFCCTALRCTLPMQLTFSCIC